MPKGEKYDIDERGWKDAPERQIIKA